MTMSRGQFVAVTVVLAAAVMAGAGYWAYAAVAKPTTPAQARQPGAGAQPGGGGSSVSVPTASADAAGSSSGPAAPAPTAAASAAGLPECRNADITVSLGQGQGAAGHISVLLLFANAAGHACYLRGYPGAELDDPSGALPPLDAVRKLTGPMGGAEGMAKAPLVTLAAGQSGSAVLEWSDVSAGSTASCYTGADELEVTPPNSTLTTKLSLGSGALVCSDFQVHPVLAAVGDTPKG